MDLCFRHLVESLQDRHDYNIFFKMPTGHECRKTELAFNIFLPFIPSVGGVSGITVNGEGCNIELSVCNSNVLLCR